MHNQEGAWNFFHFITNSIAYFGYPGKNELSKCAFFAASVFSEYPQSTMQTRSYLLLITIDGVSSQQKQKVWMCWLVGISLK
jgi:hypothetical protein